MSILAKLIFVNAITCASLLLSVASVRYSVIGEWQPAVTCIALAYLCDSVDGRLARLFSVTSHIGGILDSIADFAAFGIATGLFLYEWSLSRMGTLGVLVCAAYVLCCGFHLFRSDSAIPSAGVYFHGLPVPACCGVVLYPAFWQFASGSADIPPAALNLLLVVGASALTVTMLPFPTLRGFIRGNDIPLGIAALCVFVIAIVVFTWWSLLAIVALYAAYSLRALVLNAFHRTA